MFRQQMCIWSITTWHEEKRVLKFNFFMRYTIMLQIVAGTTVILLGAAALFAWLQNRVEPVDVRGEERSTHWGFVNQSDVQRLRR
jgi:hypothetical protein